MGCKLISFLKIFYNFIDIEIITKYIKMKKVALMILMLSVMFSACKKEETKDVSMVVDVGHPTIGLIGTPIFSTGVGIGTFVDPGAVGYNDLTHDSVPLSAPLANNVDLTTPGFYDVVWSFTISNGYINYTGTKSRLVLVTSVDTAADYSGVYARVSNGVQVNITRIGPGLYTTDNIGGVAGATVDDYLFTVYLGQPVDTVLEAPPQPNNLGGDVTIELGTFSVTLTDTSFSYRVLGAGFGTAIRVFSHQ